MNRDNFWNDEKVLEFAKLLLKERLEWAVLHDAAAAPVPMQIQLDKYKESHSIGNEEWEIVELSYPNGVTFDKLVISQFLAGDKRYSDFTIHSVLRKSDGVVFTVGDELCELGLDNGVDKITSIYPLNGTIVLGYGNKGGAIVIWAAKKLPQRTKPPLGLMPMDIWREQRLDEINAAIARYMEANMIIPSEWIAERETLISWLQPEPK